MFVCMHVCVHVCMYVCVYIYIYIYIWGSRKLGVPCFGVLIIRILLFRVLY